MSYSEDEKEALRRVAWTSIKAGLETKKGLSVNPQDYSPRLNERRTSFVTLKHRGGLRGCIGSLTVTQPLVCDVAEHAFAAAFRDPRFPAVRAEELATLALSIAVLSDFEDVALTTEEGLWQSLRPGIDGIVLESGPRRATFLPSVWESVMGPKEFMDNLKLKAGLPATFWSDRMVIKRYTVESF